VNVAVVGAGAVGASVVELAGEYGHEVIAVKSIFGNSRQMSFERCSVVKLLKKGHCLRLKVVSEEL